MWKIVVICHLIFLFVYGVSSQYDTIEFQQMFSDPVVDPWDITEPGCPKIENLKNIYIKDILGQWHLPFMSDNWVSQMAKSMHTKSTKRTSMGHACIKMNIKTIPPGTDTPNNTEATIWLQSKCPHSGAEWNLACSPDDDLNSKLFCNDLHGKNDDDDSYVYLADTDHKTWIFIVRCFPNQGVSWAILSKVKMLPPIVVKRLFRQVEDLGFKIFNVIEVPYEKCMTKPHKK